jgi:hypothetical protein
MKQFLTPHDFANTVRMMRPQFRGTILVVEGDSDARVYGRFVDVASCRVLPAHGKSNVLIAMGLIEGNGLTGIVAIVDSDFSLLDGVTKEGPNIFRTDTHDLETLILNSPALETVLAEFGSPRHIQRLGKTVRELILSVALPIGYLRWISSSRQDNLSLRFKEITFGRIVRIHGGWMSTDIDVMLSEVKQESGENTFDVNDLRERIVELLRKKQHDPWHVCRGHDMIHILTIGLRMVFGNRSGKKVTYEQVDGIMRIAFGFAEFSRTELFRLLRGWEEGNRGYRIFGEGR